MLRPSIVVAGCLLLMSGAGAAAGVPQQPTIAGYGAVSSIEGAAERPDRKLRYRVLFNITKAAATADKVNPSLEKVARFMNLLGNEGIHPQPGDVVAIIHGPATPIVAGNGADAKGAGAPANPNLALIDALQRAGLSIRVCSQALVANKIDPATVDKNVEIDLSALTTIATLQLRGWVLIPD